jgi:hypothetical protein
MEWYIPRIANDTNYHFDVKLAQEFYDAELIICITLPDKPREGSAEALKFAM